jgi:hypothetical protein
MDDIIAAHAGISPGFELSVTGECPIRHNIGRVWELVVRESAPSGSFCSASGVFFQVMIIKMASR